MLVNLWGHLSYFIFDFHEFLVILLFAFLISPYAIYRIFNLRISVRRKRILMSVVFFILSFIVLYSVFEAYFRYRFDESDSLGFLNVTQRWDARHVTYNNFQYRDDNFNVEKTPGVVRIGVMGDSNAFGYGIKNVHNRFSDLLEQKLKNNGYKVQVYNFGIPGNDTYEEINEYNYRDKAFKVDILVWQYFLNDAEPHNNSEGTKVLQDFGNKIPPFIKSLSYHSFFFDYLYWRFSSGYVQTFTKLRNADIAQYYNPKTYSYHVKLINRFTKELSSQNTKTVVVVFPFLRFLPNYPVDAFDVHLRIDNLFKDDKVSALIDLLPFLKHMDAKNLVVNRYDTHPNEFVHAIAAQKLCEQIIPLLEKTKNNGTIIKNNETN